MLVHTQKVAQRLVRFAPVVMQIRKVVGIGVFAEVHGQVLLVLVDDLT